MAGLAPSTQRSLAAITILARSGSALVDSFASLNQLGLRSLVEPTFRDGRGAAALSAGNTVIQLVQAPSAAHLVWPDRPNRTQLLKIVAANLFPAAGSGGSVKLDSTALERIADETIAALCKVGSMRQGKPGLLERFGLQFGEQPASDAIVSFHDDDHDGRPQSMDSEAALGSSSSSLSSNSSAIVDSISGSCNDAPTLKEVVIGAQQAAFDASLDALEGSGAVPTPFHSVFTFPGSPSGPALRLLRSRYSCLVFHARSPLDEIRDSVMASLATLPQTSTSATAGGDRVQSSANNSSSSSDSSSSSSSSRWDASFYGVRAGDHQSGQLLLRGGCLEGLDLRFCAARDHMPYFNEPPEEYADAVGECSHRCCLGA